MTATVEASSAHAVDLSGMRILGFCDHVSPRSCGGAERAAVEVYRRLRLMGAEVRVLTALTGTAMASLDQHGMENVIVARSLDLSTYCRAQVSVAPGLYAAGVRAVDAFRPHVLHAHSLHFQTTAVAAMLQRSRRIPLVTTAHVGGLGALPLPLRLATGAYERSVGRRILARSARAIAVSGSVAEHLSSLGVPRDRVVVIPNGVDHDVFRPGWSNGQAEGSPVPRILFVGRLIANKGPQLLVQALALLRDGGLAFHADLVGDGPMRAALERTIRRAGLSTVVELAGASTEVAAHLQAADIVVRPSFTEGMALAVLEAMASGRCVVASDIPPNADLISDGSTGLLFRSGDAVDLARVLAGALGAPAVRRRLGAAAHLDARRYSWDDAADRTGELLAAVAAAEGACGTRR